MASRPELIRIREAVEDAFDAAGIDVVAPRLVDAIADAVLQLVLADRLEAATMIEAAANTYGALDEEQLLRLAVVIADRYEGEDGEVHYRPQHEGDDE